MVKHIKKSYAKDGGLSDEEKSIAYATAWKNYNKKKKKVSESLSTKDTKKLNKASVLAYSDNPKDQDRARARQVEIDYKDFMRQAKKSKKR